MEPIVRNWIDENGGHLGGMATGIGFTISWQLGPSNNDRNGAWPIEILECVAKQLEFYQSEHYYGGKFACQENAEALHYLDRAIAELRSRRDRRASEGTGDKQDLEAITKEAMELSHADLNLCRQWFNAVFDLNPGYLEEEDLVLVKKIMVELGYRIPGSLVLETKKSD